MANQLINDHLTKNVMNENQILPVQIVENVSICEENLSCDIIFVSLFRSTWPR